MTEAPVVAGIDGSPATEAAISWAAAEAASRRTGLLLVHAFTWPGYPRPLIAGTAPPGFRTGADQVVAGSVAFARTTAPGLPVEGLHADGPPAAVLQNASRDAAVVVIGSRRRTAGRVVGSTGLQLAAAAHAPVVVVRPDPRRSSGDHTLVGYDSSPASSLALAFGLEYGRRYHLPVRVATVPRLEPELRTHPGCESVALLHLHGRPAEQLLHLAADANLLVVGARGLGGLSGTLVGSVCHTVLQRATCPVAVIPSPNVPSH